MLKKERLINILDYVNEKGMVTTSELIDRLDVSDMTIRRDLEELHNSGKVIRIHGGAQKIENSNLTEKTYVEKKEINVEEKKYVARIAASKVAEDDTIFVGSGTTLELMVKYLNVENLKIVTNSLMVFKCYQEKNPDWDVILVGGRYRKQSGAFTGNLANGILSSLKFDKTFIGVNGIHNENIMNASSEEGTSQSIALNNSRIKYIVSDSSKINRDDFYSFYSLYNIDLLITDNKISEDTLEHYEQFTDIEN